MKIVLLNGGLGNQVFQYIFGRSLEINTGEEVIFDDTYFCMPGEPLRHTNGVSAMRMQLEEVFGVRPCLLSEYFSKDVWEEMISILVKAMQEGRNLSMPQLLKDNGCDLAMITETNDYIFDGNIFFVPSNEYNPIIYNTQGNIYYHGYWINRDWLYSNREVLFKELQFKPFTDALNLNYASQIKNTLSIGVHIRKFSGEGYNWDLPEEYYLHAMKKLNSLFPNATYFVFSDAINYCKRAYKELGLHLAGNNIIFVEGNEAEGSNYKDMQLMSLCRHMIISNSSFSYLAALLNTCDEKVVINPTQRKV